MERHFTPPQIAEAYGVSPDKVLGWIRSGELQAINIATRATGRRPRYVVRESDLRAFEDRRAAVAPPKLPSRPHRPKLPQVRQFF